MQKTTPNGNSNGHNALARAIPQYRLFASEAVNRPRPFREVFRGDARDLRRLFHCASKKIKSLDDNSVDVIVTSPPYWGKRDYGLPRQIGKELTPDLYVGEIIRAIHEWKRVLRPTGSIFLNIGDTYWRKSLAGIPSRVEARVRDDTNILVRNRIIWVKKGGSPDPARDRLASRHEYIFHFARKPEYYYDLFGYAEKYSENGRGANPGDVWLLQRKRDLGKHLAPFPEEIARRAILLACPELVCTECGQPQRRRVERSMMDLDVNRPQARRALQIAKEKKLTREHIAAIQATGISDAGKARFVQTGTDRNSKRVQELAKEAKSALGGYFREFTFSKRKMVGWEKCGCGAPFQPGVVLDPFMGTGTTLDVANELGRSAIGIDLDISQAREG